MSKAVTVLSSPVSTIVTVSPTIPFALVSAFIELLELRSYTLALATLTPEIVALTVKVPRKVIVFPLHVPKSIVFSFPSNTVPVKFPILYTVSVLLPKTFFKLFAFVVVKVADNTPELLVDILEGAMNKSGKLAAVETVPAL